VIKKISKDELKDFKLLNENNPYSNYIGYFSDDEVLGYIEYLLIYDRIEISNIFVKEEYRNRKIATNMLKYLIDLSKGLVNITLEVNKNNIYAIKLYKNLGFKEVAIRKGYYNGVDGILMELVL
jgi:Acetyltransferases